MDSLVELLRGLLMLFQAYRECCSRDLSSKEGFINQLNQLLLSKEVSELLQNLSFIITDFSKENLYNGTIEVKMEEIAKIISYIESMDGLPDYIANKIYESLQNELSRDYSFLINNLDGFKKIIDSSSTTSKLSYISTLEINENEIPNLTEQKLIDIVLNFFDSIDSTNNLTNTFLDYYNNGKILFWDSNSDTIPQHVKDKFNTYNIRDCFVYYDVSTQERIINLPCKGNLVDAFSLIHEFFHCLYSSDNFCNSIFCEFPSIFMEEKFRQFLLVNGVNEKTVLACMRFREDNNLSIIEELLEDIYLLSKKINNEKLMKNDLYKKYNIDECMALVSKNDPELCKIFQSALIKFNETSDTLATSKLEFKLLNLNGQRFMDALKYFIAKDLTTRISISNNMDECAKKLLSLQSTFINSDMSEHYYFSFLGIWDYFFLLISNDNTNQIYPARIEDKVMVK